MSTVKKNESKKDFLIILIVLCVIASVLYFILSDNKGNIKIMSEPSGVEVLIGEKVKGVTPFDVKVKSGSYPVMLLKEGYSKIKDTLTIRANQDTTLNYKLSELTSKVNIKSVPDFAKVYINGIESGITPIVLELKSSVYKIRLIKDGYTGILDSFTVLINSEEEISKFYTLVPANMVYIKGGTFQMGTHGFVDQPVHAVTLSSFYISPYEVTQKEWKEIMGNNPSYFKGDSLPVETVSWYDAVSYCNHKSESEGLTPSYTITGEKVTCDFTVNGYRLPTESEWEYAARGGNKSRGYKYSGSNNLDEVGWNEFNSERRTHPFGMKKPNELGIYDMSGNVSEWCNDWYDENYYRKSPQVRKPQGPSSGEKRISRGGSWEANPVNHLCAIPTWGNPDHRFSNSGFRCVRSK